MIHEALEKIVAEQDLSRVQAEAAMEEILCRAGHERADRGLAHGAAYEG